MLSSSLNVLSFLFLLFVLKWYDPVEDCWTDSGDLFDIPYERLRYCAATLETNKRIYIFGGQADNDPKSENYAIKDSVDWYQVRDAKTTTRLLICFLIDYRASRRLSLSLSLFTPPPPNLSVGRTFYIYPSLCFSGKH